MKSIKVAKDAGCPEGFIKRDVSVKSNVYKATLDVVLAHVADFYEVMLTVMCEKYGIPVEEALTAVMESPQMKGMMLSPEFRGLSYVDEADMEKAALKGVMKKLFGEEVVEEGKSLSPLSEEVSLSSPGGAGAKKAATGTVVKTAVKATGTAGTAGTVTKKRGRPKKIVIVDEAEGEGDADAN